MAGQNNHSEIARTVLDVLKGLFEDLRFAATIWLVSGLLLAVWYFWPKSDLGAAIGPYHTTLMLAAAVGIVIHLIAITAKLSAAISNWSKRSIASRREDAANRSAVEEAISKLKHLSDDEKLFLLVFAVRFDQTLFLPDDSEVAINLCRMGFLERSQYGTNVGLRRFSVTSEVWPLLQRPDVMELLKAVNPPRFELLRTSVEEAQEEGKEL